MIDIRRTLRNLMHRCEQISGDLESIVGALAGKMSMEDNLRSVDCIKTQPQNLNSHMHLTPYQMVGINWLALMYRKKLDGILGDEMVTMPAFSNSRIIDV
jgi:SWI/SNF-related matrix-associated actin-dependent regulator 1 of chromatin subfamily A